MGNQEHEPLAIRLARSRVEPEYTMGALTERTRIPAETIRSWERRYQFPQPFRTPTNLRMYTERDIEAIRWLQEQIAQGQRIGAAIGMLRRRLEDATEMAAPQPETGSCSRPKIDHLTNALRENRLADAQQAWDALGFATSPEALATKVILPSSLSLDPANVRALAFLLRKTTVLLDHAAPDTGKPLVGILAPADLVSQVAATVLAHSLARSGAGIITPFCDPASMADLTHLRMSAPDRVTLVSPGTDTPDTGALATLLGVDAVDVWSPADDDIAVIVARITRP